MIVFEYNQHYVTVYENILKWEMKTTVEGIRFHVVMHPSTTSKFL